MAKKLFIFLFDLYLAVFALPIVFFLTLTIDLLMCYQITKYLPYPFVSGTYNEIYNYYFGE